jgi:carboxyl-terminal processing protease
MDVQERAARGALLETRAAKNVTRRLGVIELGAFYGKSGGAGRSAAEDVERIIGDLQARKAQGLILDLRDNGGGYLREAVRVAGLFIAGGPVLQTRGRRLETVSDPHPSVCYAGPLVVLVNGQTASAAEAVAAALQDYGRAVVVGDSRTGGKVTCQTTYRLGDDPRWGAARLTTLVYYRITGGVPWTEGIEPDIKLPAASAVPSPRPTAGEPGEWPAAKAVRYEPVADLRPTIAALRVKSARRAGERAVSAADDPDLAEALAVMGDLLAPGGARAE